MYYVPNSSYGIFWIQNINLEVTTLTTFAAWPVPDWLANTYFTFEGC